MPYKSDAQRRYFNANRAQLEAQGVDVDEWNDSSRGKKLPDRAKKKKTEKTAREAVIIKGNPKFVAGNKDAAAFYRVLQKYLEQKGYGVSYDEGKPHTVPKAADLWLGHSRGVDRLRFAPPTTKTISLGAPNGINHSKDKAMNPGDVPDSFHFKLTAAMRKQLDDKLATNEKSAVALLAKLAAETETLEPPAPMQSLIANTGTLGTQLGMQKGVQRYADAVIGKANPAFNRTLDSKDLLNTWLFGRLPKDPALQGRPITDSWFDKAIHRTGKFDFNPVSGTATPVMGKPYSSQRLDQYRKIMALYGKNAPTVSPHTLVGHSAAYLNEPHTVWANPGIKDDAGHILAHELGHAKQRPLLQNPVFKALRRAGSFATAYGGIAPMLRTDPDAARTDALIGTAGMLPTLGIEFDASLRGSNLMKRLAKQEGTWDKMKLLEKLKYRLGSFKGFPTYLAAASLPLASYGTRLGLGGYGTKSKPQLTDDSFGEKIKQLVDRVRGQLK